MVKADVVVVGAGPAGLLAAREAARGGVEVEVVEEHPQVGEPNHCAGVVSVEGMSRLGIEPSADFVQHEITGGRVYSPGGAFIEITGRRTRAYVVDRSVFDRRLADSVEKEGAVVETGQRVESLQPKGDRVDALLGDGRTLQADVIIDAEGCLGSLASEAGLINRRKGMLAGVNVEVSGVDVEPHMVEVWLGNNIAPRFFAWVIPLEEHVARCGLGCSAGNPVDRLWRFLDRRFGTWRRNSTRPGLVPLGGPIRRTYSDRMLVVGDAAGQTKPTTGGGVVLGGLCAIEAGRTAAAALDQGDCSAGFLRRYQGAWRASLGKEFTSMLAARRLFNGLSDERIDRLFDIVRREGLQETLQRLVDGGEMDEQGGVMRAALGDPKLLGAVTRGLGALALGELRGLFNL